jgi:hypothetical protein
MLNLSFLIINLKTHLIRATLSQYTPVTEAFDRDVGIIDMHIRDIIWPIPGKYLDILSSLVILYLTFDPYV